MQAIAELTDNEIRQTWDDWERPGSDWIVPILHVWREMGYRERVAFFCGMVLPERYGEAAEQVPLARVLRLGLFSRYPLP